MDCPKLLACNFRPKLPARTIHACNIIDFVPHPAGGKAASRVGPKIVLDHVRMYGSQPHLIGTWLIGSSGSDQDFTPDNHCYDRQVASLSVITMAYQVRNLDPALPELPINPWQVPIKWG